jgi:hypothetical protein
MHKKNIAFCVATVVFLVLVGWYVLSSRGPRTIENPYARPIQSPSRLENS